MIDALRSLARDGWVIGIACAAALAYTAVSFVEGVIEVVLAVIDGYDVPEDEPGVANLFSGSYTATVNGHLVYYGGLLHRALLLVFVVPIAAALLHATRPPEDESA